MRKLALGSMWLVLFFVLSQVELGAETAPTGGAERLNKVLDQYWHYLLEESDYSVYLRQRQGLEIKKLPPLTLESAEAEILKVRFLLKELDRIRPGDLAYGDSLTHRILSWELNNQIEAHDYYWLNIPISMYNSPVPSVNQVFSGFRFDEEKHLRQYLRLLAEYPAFIEAILTRLKEQQRRGIILSRDAIRLSTPYLGSLVQRGEKSPFYVQADRLKTLSENQYATGFQKEVLGLIASRINPGLEKLLAFVEGEYARQAPEAVGLWQYPRGKDYYGFLVRTNTSLKVSPEEIHAIGLEEIEKLRNELDGVRREVGFKGDVDAFVQFLKTSPRFKPESAREIGERMGRFKKEAEAHLPRFFSKIPKAPCGVKRLDPALEGAMTYGYYQVPTAAEPTGYYLYNASNLDKKNILNAASAALILHELLPGHHFQISLQAENESLHPLRREYFLSPYAEGWAEYASALGSEMDLYNDPYERCGRIMGDLFMSVRLVVDTGMNLYQWPRQRAKDLMKRYLLISDFEIETETLRYSTGIPAQALGYKMGGLKMEALRKKAEKALGPGFDIRRFHDVVLGSGTMPLFLLEEHVDRFIGEDSGDG